MKSITIIENHNVELRSLLESSKYGRNHLKENNYKIEKGDHLDEFIYLETLLSKVTNEVYEENFEKKGNRLPLKVRMRKKWDNFLGWSKKNLLPVLAKKINGYIKNAIMLDEGSSKD